MPPLGLLDPRTQGALRSRTTLAALSLVLGVALSPVTAFADSTPASRSLAVKCTRYTMCDAQTATGDCTSSGDEIVAQVSGRYAFTFYATQSTATTYSCNVVSNDQGHDAASGSGHQINASSLTESAPVLSFEGLFDFLWVTCPTITGGGVTVTLLVCPLSGG